jgi:nuclear RNA export factor
MHDRGNISASYDLAVTVLTQTQALVRSYPTSVRTNMYSSATSGSRTLMSTNPKPFAGIGLLDSDTRMRDVSDRPGGRKGSSKIRMHRPRPIDVYKDQRGVVGTAGAAGPSRTSTVNGRSGIAWLGLPSTPLFHLGFQVLCADCPTQLATRIGVSDPLAIRGAARPTVAGRIRRNAISLNGVRPATPPVPAMTTKTLDVWREFVKKRWSAESRFLNLEVSSIVFFACLV